MKRLWLVGLIVFSSLFTSLSAAEVTLEQEIVGLYVAFFDRAPDESGLEYWKQRGESSPNPSEVLKELSAGFATHPTFQRTYSGLDNREFVSKIYINTLGRAGDKTGIDFWTNWLDNGLSRSDMVSIFIDVALTFNPKDPQYSNLTSDELYAAQLRQDLISNKVKVALAFVDKLGTLTNVQDNQNPENDPAYIASIKIILNVDETLNSVQKAINLLDDVKNSSNPIEAINQRVQSTCIVNHPSDVDNQNYSICIDFMDANSCQNVIISSDPDSTLEKLMVSSSCLDIGFSESTHAWSDGYSWYLSDTLYKDNNVKNGVVKLGAIADANVSIYKINSSGKTELIWQEKTSSGEGISDIGLFVAHEDELDANKWYVYQVEGGFNWDINNDGIKDDNASVNKSVLRSIAKGSDIQQIISKTGKWKIDLISELLYEKVASVLKYNFSDINLQNAIDKAAAEILQHSIDYDDSKATAEDIYKFDFSTDKSVLNKRYQAQYETINNGLKEGIPAFMNITNTYNNIGKGGDEFSADYLSINDAETRAFLSTWNGVKIVDMSPDSGWKLLQTISSPANSSYSFETTVASGDTFYATLCTEGIYKFYPTDTSSQYYEKIKISDWGGCSDLDIKNDILYGVGGNKELAVIDSNGVMIKDITTNVLARRVAIASNANKAVILGYYGIDVIDLTTNQVEATYYIDGDFNDIAISGDGRFAYLVGTQSGLKILDLRDLSQISVISSLILNGRSEYIHISKDGKKLYISGFYGGLRIIDIKDIYNPKLLHVINGIFGAKDFVISDDQYTIYIVSHDGFSAIWTGELDTTSILGILKDVHSSGSNSQIVPAKDGKTVYIVDRMDGLYVVDVTDKFHPQLISKLPYATRDAVLTKNGNHLYLANGIFLDVTNPTDPKDWLDKSSIVGSMGGLETQLSQNGNIVYILTNDIDQRKLLMFSASTGDLLDTDTIVGYPHRFIEDANTKHLYIANGGQINIYSATPLVYNKHIKDINLGYEAIDLELSDDNATLFVSSWTNIYVYSMPLATDSYMGSLNIHGAMMADREHQRFMIVDSVDGISMYDLSNPLLPIHLGTMYVGDVSSLSLSYDKNFIYTYGMDNGFAISDPSLYAPIR